jgi:ATP-dependent Clp protease ATP-binding subunit ClpA
MMWEPRNTKSWLSLVLASTIFHPVARVAYVLISFLIGYIFFLANNLLAGGVLIFSFYFVLYVLSKFVYVRLRDPHAKPLMPDNVADYFSFDMLRQVLGKKLTVENLVDAAARTKRGQFVIFKLGLEPQSFITKTDEINSDLNAHPQELLQAVYNAYTKLGEDSIDANTILFFAFQLGDVFERILFQANLSLEDFQKVIEWEALHYYYHKHNAGLSPQGIIDNFGAIGRTWNLGYTNDLDRITRDISYAIMVRHPHTVTIHQDLMKDMNTYLSKGSRHNVLLLGDIGSGKTQLVQNYAQVIQQWELAKNRNLSRVLELDTTTLLSGIGDAPTYFLNALAYAERSGNIILVIDNVSQILEYPNPEITSILIKFLQSQTIHVIALDRPEQYHAAIKRNPILENLFERVDVPSASFDETLNVFMFESFRLEKEYGITVTYQALKSIYELADRYVMKGAFPGKGLQLLEDSAAKAAASGARFILESHIRDAVTEKTNVKVQAIDENERDLLLNLESTMKSEVIGQDDAVDALVKAIKRARVDLGKKDKPLGTFLFLGPTGVGKTETAKALARGYFGGKDHMIRLDMNEFSSPDSVYGIIGAPVGSEDSSESFLTQQVQDRPFSLILMDELEKAHKNVLNLFLQILDEGHLIDNRGVKTDFRNTVIIATSNAGAIFLRDYLAEHPELDKDTFRKDLIDTIVNSGTYSPEFLNRFTEIIVYYPLQAEHVVTIANNMIAHLVNEFYETKGIKLDIDEEVIAYLAKEGHSLDFGARELNRTITDVLESYLADYLILYTPQRGEVIKVTMENLQKLQKAS